MRHTLKLIVATLSLSLCGAFAGPDTPAAGATGGTVARDGTGITNAANWRNLLGVEPALGNPAGNGYFLSSTTGGVRSWTNALGTPASGDFSSGTFSWPTFNQSTTGSSATLTTGRTLGITGDLTWTSPSFNGSGNVTAAGTLATVNSNVGSFGSSTAIPAITVDAKGRITAVSAVTATTQDMLSVLSSAEISVNTTATLTISRMHVCSGTSADYTVTLPAASGNAGKFLGVRMATALTKLVTIDGAGSETIDGSLTRVMWAGEAATLMCDGTGWAKVAGKSIQMVAKGNRTSSIGIPHSTVTKILINAVDYDNQGTLVDTTNGRIYVRRPGYYSITAALTYLSMVGASGNTQVRIAKNGATGNVSGFSLRNAVADYPAPQCSIVLAAAAGDYYTVDAYHVSGSTENLYVADPVNWISLTELPSW